jgi:hypothetical protein
MTIESTWGWRNLFLQPQLDQLSGSIPKFAGSRTLPAGKLFVAVIVLVEKLFTRNSGDMASRAEFCPFPLATRLMIVVTQRMVHWRQRTVCVISSLCATLFRQSI